MTASLTLYYSPGACSMAPHVLLEEIGADFATVRVSIADRANLEPAYLAINPRGLVPALKIGGDVVTENPAILAWIAAAFPEAALWPAPGSVAQARTLEWLAWLSSAVRGAFALIWRAGRFVGEVDETQKSRLAAHGHLLLRQHFDTIESALDGRAFAVGERFGAVDASLLPFYRWGGRIGFDMPGDYPQWSRHAAGAFARPAVQRVLAREGLAG
jgi:glutathione S-transferase